jgi:hypothetical protein
MMNEDSNVTISPYPDTGEDSNIKINTIQKCVYIDWKEIIENSKNISNSKIMEAYD